jgi:hypothetical protein
MSGMLVAAFYSGENGGLLNRRSQHLCFGPTPSLPGILIFDILVIQ